MTIANGHPTTAQDFGVSPMSAAEIAAAAARRKEVMDAYPDPGDALAHVPAAPEIDYTALRIELGAKTLLGVSSEPPPPLILDRIDPEGHTVLFGDGGVGKGTLAAVWAVGMVNSGMRVLIVDYENHPTEWSRRVLGLGDDEARERVVYVAPLSPDWTLKRGPIWDQAKTLRTLANAVKADVLIVDSIVMACAGEDPMDTSTATAYAAALELIGRPVLSLAHTTKLGELRYPFGSVFWHNLARTTWSLSRDGERALLQHRKRNNYASLGKFVVTMSWRDGLPREVWEQGYSANLSDRCADLLTELKRLSLEQLVNALNDEDEADQVKADSVRKALARGIPDRFRLDGGVYRLNDR